MIFAVLSDIHANLEALRAVLAEVDRRAVDQVLCLGDVVGYNADPDQCMRLVLDRCATVIRGNHDKAAVGLMDLQWFNPVAREAALWTARALRPDMRERLRDLRAGPRDAGEGVLICHGSPCDEDEYVLPGLAVEQAFRCLDESHGGIRVCLHGHTHRPLAAFRTSGKPAIRVLQRFDRVDLEPKAVSLLNPGSVGQPRDGNTMASFGILDTGRMTFTVVRVSYAVGETQRKVLAAGLPPGLARRLGEGW